MNAHVPNQLVITPHTFHTMMTSCRLQLPHEACGLIVRGEHSDSADIVIPIRNIHPAPQHAFAFDPEEWTKAYFSIQKNRQLLVGYYHSHPRSAAAPSTRDHEGWLPQSGLIYCIVSLADTRYPEVMTYTFVQDQFVPIPLMLA
ncbi:M67 family metallopeptidase [Paenibacillus sp. strain BS8-2]